MLIYSLLYTHNPSIIGGFKVYLKKLEIKTAGGIYGNGKKRQGNEGRST